MEDERLTRIEEKLDRVVERIGSIDVTLAEQHLSLRHHIKRTDLLEATVKPIKSHVDRVDGVVKFLGVVALVLGIAAAISKML